MQDRIFLGDVVRVEFSNHPALSGEVLSIPQATGDAWHIREKDGTIIYVQQYDFMVCYPAD